MESTQSTGNMTRDEAIAELDALFAQVRRGEGDLAAQAARAKEIDEACGESGVGVRAYAIIKKYAATRAPGIQAKLESTKSAVFEADAAWEADLDNADLAKNYKQALAAFRATEREAIELHYVVPCGRCGGTGYVAWGIGDKTCFDCLGGKMMPFRGRTEIGPNPKTRAKRAAEHAAKQAAQDAAYNESLSQLPAAVATALLAAEAEYDRLGGYYDPSTGEELDREQSFRYDLASKLRKYGSLSAKQVEAIERGLERDAKKAADAEALKSAPALEGGKRELVGEIVSNSWRESQFGTTHKMLVKLDDGNKVWGTVPAKLDDLTVSDWDDDGKLIEPEIDDLNGLRVSFSATVERSNDDPHFGFFKRPTKIKVEGR